jgi:hypothetical protein
MGAPFTPPRCARHSGAAAGWRCTGCGAALCPGCVYEARSGTATYPACTRCRSLADVIRAPRSELQPFAARLGRALIYPVSPGALLACVGCAAVMWLLRWVPLVGWILSYGLYWAFLFGVIRQSSRGATDFEPPDVSDPLHELFAPAFRGLVATALVWLPAAVRLGFALASQQEPSLRDALLDPGLWLILLAGALYAPAAILHAAHGDGVLTMLNPVRVLVTALRLGGDYLLACAAAALVLAVDLGMAVAFPTGFGSIFFVSAVAAGAVGLVAPMLACHILGLLLYVRGDAVGLGPASDYEVPVLGDRGPRGAEPVLQTTVAAPSPSPQPIALEPEPEPEPAAPPDPAAGIAAAVRAGDLVTAARLYHAVHAAPPPLAPAVLYQVARGAAQASAPGLAARALHAAATAGDPAVAPDALLALARLYQGKLGKPAESLQVLRHLVQRYPETAAARQARTTLGAD